MLETVQRVSEVNSVLSVKKGNILQEKQMGNTVAELRKNKYQVQVIHFRRYKDPKTNEIFYSGFKFDDGLELLPHGGKTVVRVRAMDDTLVTGIAKCCVHDNYVKRRGVHIALARAVKQLNE